MWKIITVALLLCSTFNAFDKYVFTIHHVSSFHSYKIRNAGGCGQRIVFGTYIEPTGSINALRVFS